jgi:hypothetical protein
MVVSIGLQLALPDNLVLLSRWLLPGLELALLLALIIASPEGPRMRCATGAKPLPSHLVRAP